MENNIGDYIRIAAGVILMGGFILVLVYNFCSLLDEKDKKDEEKKKEDR